LANRARITVDEARAAIESFLNADPDSRTPDHEGRRIERIDGGWRLLNHGKYRALCDEEEKRIRHAKNQAAYRERQKLGASVTGCVTEVTESDHIAEAEAEAEAIKDKSIVESSASDRTIGGAPSSPEGGESERRVREVWDYFLERTGKYPAQYLFTRERRTQGLKGFESLVAFVKRCKAPDPLDAASKLFRVAVDRLADSPFHNGKNDQGKTYLDWHQLFRSKDFPSPTKLVEFWLDDSRWSK
jgi:hypothetical protein